MINFAYTILYVKDVSATLAFYGKAFGLKQKFLTPENNYGELETGNTTLSFASLEMAQSNLPDGFIESDINKKPQAVEIAFTTDDVEKTYKNAIQQGATPVTDPKVKPWGQTVGYVRDPNGFLIEICSPIN